MNSVKRNGIEYRITELGVRSDFNARYQQKNGNFDEKQYNREPERHQVDLCRDWLDKFASPRKTVNNRHSSYGLKHRVEAHCHEYISNGAFIQAVYEMGEEHIVFSSDWRSSNANFKLNYDKQAMGER